MAETEFTIEPGRQDIVMTRVFDAPPHVVCQAITDPDLLPKWWGPSQYDTVVERMEATAGGSWRIVHRDPEGNEYAFRGVYHDVVVPQRITSTFEFEGAPGHVVLETTTLDEVDGKTKYVSTSVYDSVEGRDAMVRSGMQDGARETMDRLAAIVEGR